MPRRDPRAAALAAAAAVLFAAPAAGQVRVLPDRVEPAGGIAFATGAAAVLESSLPTLAALAEALAQNPSLRLEVQVHSDARGSAAYNLRMSQERAAALVACLVGLGVAPERLVARGYGETCPVTVDPSAAGQRENRRVVFFRLDAGLPCPCPAPPPVPPGGFPDPDDARRQEQ
jgi:outer membrane protein OmpA-like peptidoglycan-associated protein